MAASHQNQLHFVLIPLLAPGHLFPMVDMGRLLASHGVFVTIITTPLNAETFKKIIDRDVQDGLKIQLIRVPFPHKEVSLPEGCERLDNLRSRDLSGKFMDALIKLEEPIEKVLKQTDLYPSCVVSDRYLPWTANITRKLKIPRLAFDGTNCFSLMCLYYLQTTKIYEKLVSDREPFLVPGLPGTIELTKAQLPSSFNPGPIHMGDLQRQREESDMTSYGLVVNSFEELEPAYVEEYRKTKGDKVWCIGPVSLCNKGSLDRSQRGNSNNPSNIDKNQSLLHWLDSWPQSSVLYVCLGTLSHVSPQQLMELGLALEALDRPFIWVLKEEYKSSELEELMLKERFEERIKKRGLLIRGWAPQVLILSHSSIGGFLTHCGWNSTLEGISAGVPLITWPLLAEQSINEKLVVQVLKIGVSVGVDFLMKWGEEDNYGVIVKKEEIMEAVEKVMSDTDESRERRKIVKKLGEMAGKALGEGGSSYVNIKLLIDDIKEQVTGNKDRV